MFSLLACLRFSFDDNLFFCCSFSDENGDKKEVVLGKKKGMVIIFAKNNSHNETSVVFDKCVCKELRPKKHEKTWLNFLLLIFPQIFNVYYLID